MNKIDRVHEYRKTIGCLGGGEMIEERCPCNNPDISHPDHCYTLTIPEIREYVAKYGCICAKDTCGDICTWCKHAGRCAE